MRLTSLEISRLAGIDEPLRLSALLPGVNVVVGPNASGKSSLMRALLALLYPREHEGVIDVEARFQCADGSSLLARRLGRDVGWESAGRPTAAPVLPAAHLVGMYTIRLEDLVTTGRPAPPPARRGPGRPPAAASAGSDSGTDLDRLIADSIVRQLTGGIDIEAVRRSLGKQAEAGRRLSGAVNAARKERLVLEQRRTALSEREDKLPAQRRELAAARESASRLHLVVDAGELLGARERAAQIETERRSYPPDLDRLRGDEDESLAKLSGAARVEEGKVAEQTFALEGVRQALAASALRTDLDSAEVNLQLERADALVEDAAKLERKAAERRALQAQLREAARRAGAPASEGRGGDVAGAEAGPSGSGASRGSGTGAALDVTDEAIERVEELLERRQAARAEGDALLRQRNKVPRPQPVEDGVSEDQLVRLRANLLRWSSAPPVEPRRPVWAWGIALALATAVVGAGSLGAQQALMLALAGATVTWLLILGLLVPPLTSAVRRQVEAETRRAQTQHGLTGPDRWEHAEVADLVVAIDDELAARRRTAAAARQHTEAARDIDADLADARAREEHAQAELDAMRVKSGFAAGSQVLLAGWLHAVRDIDRLRTAGAGVEVEGARLAERVKRATEALHDFLNSAGQPSDRTADLPPEELRAVVRGLARAVEQRDADRRRLASLTTDLDRSRAELTRLTGERARLLSAAGLADGQGVEDELRSRLAAAPAWRELSQRRRVSQARVEALELRLAGEEELMAMVAAGDHGALAEAAAACVAAQARSEDLSRTISQTEREIELAASDGSISQATARLEQANEELDHHRHEALRLAAAHFLVDAVEAEHRSEARPPALARAAVLFKRFTREEFELRFDADPGARRRLAASDRSGRVLELNELSTGTRAQLLIASRLAFALEAEGASVPGEARAGSPADARGTAAVGDRASPQRQPPPALPFFLDEALTTSDPERFAAVAAAVLDVATLEGRQFIYLSARADDAELWQRAAAAHGTEIAVVQLGSHGAGSAAVPAAN